MHAYLCVCVCELVRVCVVVCAVCIYKQHMHTQVNLPSAPVAMDLAGDYLMLLDATSVVAVYHLRFKTRDLAPWHRSQGLQVAAALGPGEVGERRDGDAGLLSARWLTGLLSLGEARARPHAGGAECLCVATLRISGPTPPLAVSILDVQEGGRQGGGAERNGEAVMEAWSHVSMVALVQFVNGDLVRVSARAYVLCILAGCAFARVCACEIVLNVYVRARVHTCEQISVHKCAYVHVCVRVGKYRICIIGTHAPETVVSMIACDRFVCVYICTCVYIYVYMYRGSTRARAREREREREGETHAHVC